MVILLHISVLWMVFKTTHQHGYLDWPPQRGSLWRYGYDTPKNYNDNALFCGGRGEIEKTLGKCGVCGDEYYGIREHEAGGKFALGIIGASYPIGTKAIKVRVRLTTHHRGFFEFRICPNNNIHAPVSQECLDRHILRVKGATKESGYTRYYPEVMKNGHHLYHLMVELPPGMTCSQCVLSWRYKTGNSWGTDSDGKSCLGCGVQEEFRNCADISIGDDVDTGNILSKTSKTHPDVADLNKHPKKFAKKDAKIILFDFSQSEKNQRRPTGSDINVFQDLRGIQKQTSRGVRLLNNDRDRVSLVRTNDPDVLPIRTEKVRSQQRIRTQFPNSQMVHRARPVRRMGGMRRPQPRRFSQMSHMGVRPSHFSRGATQTFGNSLYRGHSRNNIFRRISPVSNEQALLKYLPVISTPHRTRNTHLRELERNPSPAGQLLWRDNLHILNPMTNIGLLPHEQSLMATGHQAMSTFNRAQVLQNGFRNLYNVRVLFPLAG